MFQKIIALTNHMRGWFKRKPIRQEGPAPAYKRVPSCHAKMYAGVAGSFIIEECPGATCRACRGRKVEYLGNNMMRATYGTDENKGEQDMTTKIQNSGVFGEHVPRHTPEEIEQFAKRLDEMPVTEQEYFNLWTTPEPTCCGLGDCNGCISKTAGIREDS